MGAALLEVLVRHVHDLPGVQEGGADRVFLAVAGDGPGSSPDLTSASAVIGSTDLPVRVMVRLGDGYSTTGGEFTRLVGLAEKYVTLGAEGVAFGFLDRDLEIDVDTCLSLAREVAGVPWTFHGAFDAALDLRRAWRDVKHLPGLTAVVTGGSARGLDTGYEDLLGVAESDPDVARLALPGPGLVPEHVPWLVRAGIRQFHLGPQTRPDGSDRAYVDPSLVRSWRLLIDDSMTRAGA